MKINHSNQLTIKKPAGMHCSMQSHWKYLAMTWKICTAYFWITSIKSHQSLSLTHSLTSFMDIAVKSFLFFKNYKSNLQRKFSKLIQNWLKNSQDKDYCLDKIKTILFLQFNKRLLFFICFSSLDYIFWSIKNEWHYSYLHAIYIFQDIKK